MNFSIFGIFLVILLTNTPIAIALSITTLIFIISTTNIPIYVLAQQMFSSIDTSLLLAVIFFILAGNIMASGKISGHLVKMGNSMLGMTRGGLAISSVLACMFFAAISGSSPATVIAIGSIMIPALVKAGYGKHFSMGLLTSAGSMGILIPPSIPMVIYGLVMSVSVTKQFMAGILPGFVLGGAFIVYTFLVSYKNGWRGETPANWSEIGKAFRAGIWSLSLPFIILGGIYSGIFTPTEAAAVSVVAALVIEILIYRSLKISEIPKICRESALSSASLLFIISAAGAMSWYMGVEQIPNAVADWIGATIKEGWLFLLLVNFFLLFLGCFMDLVSAMLILGPIFLPLIQKFNIDPLHFGIIMIINIEIGFLTPPFGINLFVSCGMLKESMSEVAKGVWPFIILMFAVLLIITYIPSISTFLPYLLLR